MFPVAAGLDLLAALDARPRRQPGHPRQALAVGGPAPVHGARAVLDGHLGAAHRPAAVEGGHPHQRVLGAPLEVHGEVGHQRRRGDVHGPGLLEQRLTEPRALQLDHVEPGTAERQPDDLERVGASRLRQLRLLDAGRGTGEDRRLALGLGHPAQPRQDLAARLRRDAEHRGLDALEPVGDAALRLVVRAQQCHLHPRLVPAQRHRQHGIGALEDAEARGELGERGKRGGLHGEREARGVDGPAVGVVDQIGRHLQTKGRALGEGRVEAHVRVQGLAGVARFRFPPPAARSYEREPARLGPRDRRRERHPQRRHGQAVRVLALALAREVDLERRAHAELEPLILGRRHAGRRRDALAPHQRDPRAVGESLA